MPASYGLTWEPKTRRWRKQHEGKRHVVSIRDLKRLGYLPGDAVETKEASYQAANRWWADRLKEAVVDPRFEHPHGSAIAVAERKRDWSQRHGETADAEKYAEQARTLRGLKAEDDPDAVLGLDDRAAWTADAVEKLTGNRLPMPLRRVLFDDPLWAERFSRDEPTPPDRKLSGWIDKYLEVFQVRQKGGDISPAEYQGARMSLHAFRDWQGGESSIDDLNAATWEGWWRYQREASSSIPTKTKRLRFVRSFVRWMASRNLIPLPPSIDDRMYGIKSRPTAIEMPDEAVIKRTIAEAPGQSRLHLLLMLNTAMTQIDIANLRQDEVDWARGRIRRKRSKTKDKENVPVVEYPLWADTFALLKRYRQPSGDLVLLTLTGKPWIRDSIDAGGKRHKTDAITSNYRHLRKRLKIDMVMSKLRKAGASLIADNHEFARFHQRMLGHAPTSVAERFYIGNAAGQDDFDRAVRWVGERFGFSSKP